MTIPAWMTRAACVGLNPELFFPEPAGGHTASRQAKQVCAECPVAAACLAYAIQEHIHYGIWGGTDPTERPGGRRGRPTGPINHGTEGGYMSHRRRNEPACADCLAAHARRAKERAAARGGW